MIELTVKLTDSELLRLQRMNALSDKIKRDGMPDADLEEYCRLREQACSDSLTALLMATRISLHAELMQEVLHV